MFYPCGEPIAAERIQDEPWYDDYQVVSELMCAGIGEKFYERFPDGLERAKVACREYLEQFPGPTGWLPPNDEQLERWIKSLWLNDSQMAEIDKLHMEK